MQLEQRKEYNKNYYQANREEILKKAKTKVECELCHRLVSSYNITKHYTLPICKRKSELLAKIRQNNANQV
jgi:hypothetical protein